MKSRMKSALICLIFLGLYTAANAQSKSHIYGGYGTGTAVELYGDIADAFFSELTDDPTDSGSSRVFFAGYRTHVSERFEVSGLVKFENYRSESENRTTHETSKEHIPILGIMAEGKYNYLMKNKWRLYSAGMAGVGIGTSGEGNVGFAFHVDAIGFSYGNKVSPFLNLGLGFKGLVNVGVQIGL